MKDFKLKQETFLSELHRQLLVVLNCQSVSSLYLIVGQVEDVDVGDLGEGGVADGGDPVAGQPEAVEAAEAAQVVVPDLCDGVVAQVEGLELRDQGAQEPGNPGQPVGVHRQVSQLPHGLVAEIQYFFKNVFRFILFVSRDMRPKSIEIFELFKASLKRFSDEFPFL